MHRSADLFASLARPLALALLALAAVPAGAIEPPAGTSPLAAKAMRHPDLHIPPAEARPTELPPAPSAAAFGDLAALGAEAASARLDLRGDRWTTLLPGASLLPELAAGAPPGGPAAGPALERRAWEAFGAWLESHRRELRIDPAELAEPGRVTVHSEGELIQIHVPRRVDGIPVRDSYLTAVLNHGNLVLFGASRWGDVEVPTIPALDAAAALTVLGSHLEGNAIEGLRARPRLELVALAQGRDTASLVPGRGYAHRLVWVLAPAFAGELGSWEAVVDAHTGELLSFEDRNVYAATQREVEGGVYPVSNDGAGADGSEQAGWPMPFAEIATAGGPLITDAGGNAPFCIDGNISSDLSGPFVRMNDLCGVIDLSSGGSLDFGTSGGTDCTTPGTGGAGNTHSARTGFHELNRIREQAKAQLPGNSWLDQQLTATMNISGTCNAFWNGTVNFYRSGGGCANTGELAGVFDHEWGHGMDDNDANPSISSPGEGIADLYTYFRLNTSCIGRGFLLAGNCGGYGDPCLDCTGVREIDWAKRSSAAPHDVVWADACAPGMQNGPCGGTVHCEGQIYAEAVYDLVNRDLPTLFGMDHNTAFELGTRLTYLGGGNVGQWFSCDTTPPLYGGCAATSGYQQFLAADDDDGNLANGTPHMSAIFAAFDRHGIACDTPAVADSGCAGAPTSAPVVTATPRGRGVDLTWGAVAGATKYQVFRTDGVHGCDFGKTKVGETTGTSFEDTGLQNGRDYSYIVIPIGAGDTCMGPASACVPVTPGGPELRVDPDSVTLAFSTGDSDDFLDNCERATVSFDVQNIGTVAQTNVQIDTVRVVTHPSTTIEAIGAVVPGSLAVCGTASGSFELIARGLAPGDTAVFEVDLTSDQLSPRIRTAVVEVRFTESDLQFAASKLWDFESDRDGWTLVQGVFDQTTSGGGAEGSSGYLDSSSFLVNQCDQVRSPPFQLRPTSTLSLWTNFDIEPQSGGTWYDRANVGILEGGLRTAIAPDSGRVYNASGGFAYCVTEGQDGWASAMPTWASSGWSATALDATARAGRTVQLDIAYGSDFVVADPGFSFDRVNLTDVDLLVPDAQSDVCPNTPPTVDITAPADEQLFDVGDSISFNGAASDIEDGDLTSALAWTSDIDGAIGSTGSFSTTLTAGYHTVTAQVTDSGLLIGSDVVRLPVEDPPGCPADLTVDDPTVGGTQSFAAVRTVTLGPDTTFLTGSDVTVSAAKSIGLENGVAVHGTMTLLLTPTPCP